MNLRFVSFLLAALVFMIVSARELEARTRIETFRVGQYPQGMAFDGTNIWIPDLGHGGGAEVTVLRAEDGALVGTFPIPAEAAGAAFDGVYIWLTNPNSLTDTVTRMRLDGTVEGTYPAGKYDPYAILFDGSNIWVTFRTSNFVSKLRASDAALLGTFETAPNPPGATYGLAYDGANIWVTNLVYASVTKLRASDGVVLGTFPAGDFPDGIAFDGTNIWIANILDDTLTKLNASDGTLLGTGRVPAAPEAVLFDGKSIWVTSANAGLVSEFAGYGHKVRTFPTGDVPQNMLFDGKSIWTANFHDRTVTKITLDQP